YKPERLTPSNSHCRRTLISGLSRSTSGRISSIEHADFFFEPIQFHLQPHNLFVDRVAVGVLVPTLARSPVHEKLRQLFQSRLPPLCDLDGVHLELRPQLAERLLATDRLDRHPRLELRAVLFPRRRHRPLLVNDSVEILAYCLV